VILAAVLSSCSEQSGVDLARQACAHVHQAIAAYESGLSSTGSARVSDLRHASQDLQAAEPLAAEATSSDGQWNALMTTLNEIGQVDEGHLINALRAQCAVADSSDPELPDVPTSLPPAP
jgi:hypothetical protein